MYLNPGGCASANVQRRSLVKNLELTGKAEPYRTEGGAAAKTILSLERRSG